MRAIFSLVAFRTGDQCDGNAWSVTRLKRMKMAVAVGFPSSRVFASAWSDEAIQHAYGLRAHMYDNGFEHVWLRCDE